MNMLFAAVRESVNGTNAKSGKVCFRAAVGVIADVMQTSFEDRCQCGHQFKGLPP